MGDQEAEVKAVLLESGESNMDEAQAKASELIDQLNNINLNIAVTGVTGAGKSSFVNAIRGVDDADEDKAAPTGVVETTMEPTEYPHPTMPNVKIWDLPGIGSPNFTAANYNKIVNFEKYDFFLILTSDRVREHDINLAREVRKKKKNFYFIRSKIDQDVAAAARRRQSEEHILKLIRDDCERRINEFGSRIFLVSSHHLEKFEFSNLVKALEKDLPENKRNALIQSLPVYSMEILEKKYKKFKNITWALALASGAIAAAPVPGLSLAADMSMLVAFLTKVYFSFGLDDKSLQKLSEKVNKPILVKIKAIPLVKALAEKSWLGIMRTVALLTVSEGIESALSLIPILGNIAAAGLSFVTTLSALRQALKVLYDAAKEMIEMAGLNQ